MSLVLALTGYTGANVPVASVSDTNSMAASIPVFNVFI